MLSREVNYVFPHELIKVFVDIISRHDFNKFEREVANQLHSDDNSFPMSEY